MAAPFTSFTSVPSNLSPVMIGQVTWAAAGIESAYLTALNLNGAALDKWTQTVSSTGPVAVNYTYNGISYSETIPASPTAAEVISNLGDIEGQVVLLQIADLEATGATTWTATARQPGVTFTMVLSTNQAVSHTTTSAVGSDIPQARAVLGLTTGSGPGSDSTYLASTLDNLALQVMTHTITYGAGSYYAIFVTLMAYKNGADQRIDCGKVAATSDTATDCTNIAAAINTAVPANSILSTGASGTTVVNTAEMKGLAFDVDILVTGGASVAAKAYTTGAPGAKTTDLNAAFLGIVPHTGRIVLDSNNDPVWKAGAQGPIAGIGPFHLTMNDTDNDSPAAGAPVWLYTGATNTGAATFSQVAGAAPLYLSIARVVDSDTATGVKIRFNPNTY